MKAIALRMATLLCAPLVALALGCDSAGSGTTNSFCDSPLPNQSGKVAGQPCEKNEDCQSNSCATDPYVSPSTKICIRSCSSACSPSIECRTLDLPSEGVSYTPLRFADSLGNQLCHCAAYCNSDLDCKKISDQYDKCVNPGIGAAKICVISALNGGPGGDGGGTGGGDGGGTGGGDGTGGGGSDGGGGGSDPLAGCYKTSEAPNPNGSMPGEPCEKNEDCVHGLCTDENPNVTGGNFKVCAKKCGGCPGFTPECLEDDDPAAHLYYTCVKPAGFQGKFDHCAIRCDSSSGLGGLDGCQGIEPGYTSCNSNNAGKDYCGAQ